jgi:predicted MFS family arabinose efflux permease
VKRLMQRSAALREVLGNRDLERLQAALAGSMLGYWGLAIALAVWAFEEGGAGLAGVALFVRLFPTAVCSPLAGAIADRYPRRAVMLTSDLVRAGTLVLAALSVAADLPVALTLVFIGINGAVSAAFRPAQAALLPTLARTPEELTAANVVSSAVESVGMFAGPALGALLLVATNVQVVFLVAAATLLWSASLIARIEVREPGRTASGVALPGGLGAQTLQGFATIGREPELRVLVGLAGAQTLVAGALNVLLVVTALEVLDAGRAWVGYLDSSVGVGGVLGAFVASTLVGRQRLSGGVAAGLFLWGAPLVLLGAFPSKGVGLVALVAIGVANTLIDVSVFTLLQRAVPDAVLARVFGVLEAVMTGCIAVGGIATPLVISALGGEGALVATGAVLPVLTVLAWRTLRGIDATAPAPGPALDLLRSLPIFAPLSPVALEKLALKARLVRASAGSTLFAQGDHGDRFYVIASGSVDVVIDRLRVRTQGPGEGFGEIALLRDIPRTATIVVRERASLYALDRADFIAAVTGHAESAAAADSLVGARLENSRQRYASV